ncbi:hypothetical protein BC828DRAFT_373403 [Blastocladiella britannica]|nr:hypothetical protein BC828DRAFT_373403 [Blastocladiella britannica]
MTVPSGRPAVIAYLPGPDSFMQGLIPPSPTAGPGARFVGLPAANPPPLNACCVGAAAHGVHDHGPGGNDGDGPLFYDLSLVFDDNDASQPTQWTIPAVYKLAGDAIDLTLQYPDVVNSGSKPVAHAGWTLEFRTLALHAGSAAAALAERFFPQLSADDDGLVVCVGTLEIQVPPPSAASTT